MNFSKALEALKIGFKVERSGWSGNDLYVQLINPYGLYSFDTKEDFEMKPFFIIRKRGTLGTNTWVPSVSDLLAEDWKVLE